MIQSNQQFRIIAQPKACYRVRYGSEQYRNGSRVQRYIRAEDNHLEHQYPTVEIPREWFDGSHRTYIRVASVTVPNENVSIVCVHPYPIDTDEPNVEKDPTNNALYFPITKKDFKTGRKSFLLTRKKLVQTKLNQYGPLSIYNSDQKHISHSTEKSPSKQLIETYKLWRSQLVFSRAEQVDKDVFQLFSDSSVSSQIISDNIKQQRKQDTTNAVVQINPHENSVICVPERGIWTGGDKVLMVLTKLDRKKPFRIYFDYSEMNEKYFVKYELVDMKTITFQTPPCVMTTSNQNRTISIVVLQEENVIGKCNFLYLAPSAQLRMNEGSCHPMHSSSDFVCSIRNNKRSRLNFDDLVMD